MPTRNIFQKSSIRKLISHKNVMLYGRNPGLMKLITTKSKVNITEKINTITKLHGLLSTFIQCYNHVLIKLNKPEATGSNPVEAPKVFFSGYFRNCLNCDSLRWSHTHFICIPAVHIITFSVSFLSRVDELNKLASLQCMGLHSSAGRALQR